MRVLVVDDELLARQAITNVLDKRRDVERYESAENAIDAIAKLSSDPHDVLVVDIDMPSLSGMDLVDRIRAVKSMVPAVVFVTAHAEHALAAFDRHATDYVLKPFENRRLEEALEVASLRSVSERVTRLEKILPSLHQLPKPPVRIAIKTNGRILFVDPQEVFAVKAEGNYVVLQRASSSDLLRESISVIEEKLKRYGFVRIHRSILVNCSQVHEVRAWTTGEYGIRLKNGMEYTITRKYKRNLKHLAESWLGVDTFAAE